MILTTGSWPRRLPAKIGGDLRGVYSMRDLADADAMADEFQEGRRALIIGGGYIGLEAAAVAAKKGVKVTLVEMADRILQRVAAPQTSDFFRAAHAAQGDDAGSSGNSGNGEGRRRGLLGRDRRRSQNKSQDKPQGQRSEAKSAVRTAAKPEKPTSAAKAATPKTATATKPTASNKGQSADAFGGNMPDFLKKQLK